MLLRRDSRQTHHARLGDGVGDENEEDAEDSSDLDGEAAWLALQAETTACSVQISGFAKATLATGGQASSALWVGAHSLAGLLGETARGHDDGG